MTDHAEIRVLLGDLYQRGQDMRDGERVSDEIVLIVNALVAERDEWKHAAGAEADLFDLAQERTKAAEAELAEWKTRAADLSDALGGCMAERDEDRVMLSRQEDENRLLWNRAEAVEAERDGARRAVNTYEGAMNAQLALRSAAEAEREIILSADEVCACLHETGERTVRIYERCERCRALMESEYPERLEAAEAEIARLREAMVRFSRLIARAALASGSEGGEA